jgi:hypothetical protein
LKVVRSKSLSFSSKSFKANAASAPYAAGASSGPTRTPAHASRRRSRGLANTTYFFPSAASGRRTTVTSSAAMPVR